MIFSIVLDYCLFFNSSGGGGGGSFSSSSPSSSTAPSHHVNDIVAIVDTMAKATKVLFVYTGAGELMFQMLFMSSSIQPCWLYESKHSFVGLN
jgi:hypothetical protein